MLEEFKLGLLRGNEPAAVAKELTDRARDELKQREQEIERSKKRAEFIAMGLKEPPGSEPRTVAESYLKQYEQDTGEQESSWRNVNVADELRKSVEGM